MDEYIKSKYQKIKQCQDQINIKIMNYVNEYLKEYKQIIVVKDQNSLCNMLAYCIVDIDDFNINLDKYFDLYWNNYNHVINKLINDIKQQFGVFIDIKMDICSMTNAKLRGII